MIDDRVFVSTSIDECGRLVSFLQSELTIILNDNDTRTFPTCEPSISIKTETLERSSDLIALMGVLVRNLGLSDFIRRTVVIPSFHRTSPRPMGSD